MKTPNERQEKNKSSAHDPSHNDTSTKGTFQFVDNRPEAIAQKRLQVKADNSPVTQPIKTLQLIANGSGQHPTQLQKTATTALPVIQLVRMNITRDAGGGAAKVYAPGQISNNVTVSVTNVNNVAFTPADENLIFAAAMGGAGALHQSKKVKNIPAGYQGYIHNYGTNTIFSVTRIDNAHMKNGKLNPTIQIHNDGNVNAGWHNFN